MSRITLAVAIAISLIAGATFAQDALTIGSGSAAPGASATVNVSVRDASGTPLGSDAGAGKRIQGIAFKVTYSPASSVQSIAFARAGVLAPLTPLYEQTIPSTSAIAYIASFSESSNSIPLTLNGAAPGNLIGTLQVTLSPGAPGGSTVTLTIDSATATFSNQAGTTGETNALGGLTLVNGSVSVTGASIAAPTGLVATATSTTQVVLTWNEVAGADHYELWRSSNGGAYVQRPADPAITFPVYFDGPLDANTTYLYYVKAVDTGSALTSGPSNVDYATTIVFTDDPLGSGTKVKAVHVDQLRIAVNAFRAAAGQTTPMTFTDDPLTGVRVKGVHIQELRDALNNARQLLGFGNVTYSDAVLGSSTTVKTSHVQQVRNAVK